MVFHAELARTELSKSTLKSPSHMIQKPVASGRHQEQDAGAGAGVGMRTSALGSRTSVRGDALRDAAARGVVRSTATGLRARRRSSMRLSRGPCRGASGGLLSTAPCDVYDRLAAQTPVRREQHHAPGAGGGASVSAARLSTGPPAAPTASTRLTGGTMLSARSGRSAAGRRGSDAREPDVCVLRTE